MTTRPSPRSSAYTLKLNEDLTSFRPLTLCIWATVILLQAGAYFMPDLPSWVVKTYMTIGSLALSIYAFAAIDSVREQPSKIIVAICLMILVLLALSLLGIFMPSMTAMAIGVNLYFHTCMALVIAFGALQNKLHKAKMKRLLDELKER